MVKRKGLLGTKIYFGKLDQLVKNILAKCACSMYSSQKNTPTSNFNHYTTPKNHG